MPLIQDKDKQQDKQDVQDHIHDGIVQPKGKHGDLWGLDIDDHEQYHNDERGDLRYIKQDGTKVYSGTGDGFKDEDDMASDAADAAASQQSIKAYVDSLTEKMIFGDGSDGSVVISGTSFSEDIIVNNALTRDAFYLNLTLTGGDLDCAGFKLRVKGILTEDNGFKVHRNGNNGANGATGAAGGAGGAGGAALADGTLKGVPKSGNGGEGKDGGADGQVGFQGDAIGNARGLVAKGATGGNGAGGFETSGGAGRDGGSYTAADTEPRIVPTIEMMIDTGNEAYFKYIGSSGAGGGGGGGGENNSGNRGGGGGGAGGCAGVVFIAAKTLVLNGTIEAKGGNGGAGGVKQGSAGNGGGGAAGNGGVIVLIYESKTGAGSISVVKGTQGAGASAGGAGTDGNLYEFSI